MYISEGTIAETFQLDITGDRWFKKGKVDETLLNQFLLPEFQNQDWSKGIPLSIVLKEWRMILFLVNNYISCEGRYNLVFRYHMNFLLHMTGDTQMNLPFFILKSLQKMSMKVQKFPNSVESSLAHTCLITTLVYHELCCYGIDENIFLVDVGFDLRPELDA